MTITLWSILGLGLSMLLGLLAYGRSRYREGKKDMEHEVHKKAVDDQKKMADILLESHDPDKLDKRLRDGEF